MSFSYNFVKENNVWLQLTVKSCTIMHLYILYYACKFTNKILLKPKVWNPSQHREWPPRIISSKPDGYCAWQCVTARGGQTRYWLGLHETQGVPLIFVLRIFLNLKLHLIVTRHSELVVPIRISLVLVTLRYCFITFGLSIILYDGSKYDLENLGFVHLMPRPSEIETISGLPGAFSILSPYHARPG